MNFLLSWIALSVFFFSSLIAGVLPATAKTTIEIDYSQRVPLRISFGQLRWGIVAAKGRVLG
ncbi:MAG: hypothetical protein M0036_05675, partial [Desulfobacteraceae bacterium]|nr:hypothetical protein [Desulfobacteraceae bacterium]